MSESLHASLAGSYDGVFFDRPTARVALEIANQATFEQLTQEGNLRTAVANRVVGGRPYASLAEVAETYGIGTAKMQALHDYASAGF
jgi:hypothetical protein